jgi:hypothetical protein
MFKAFQQIGNGEGGDNPAPRRDPAPTAAPPVDPTPDKPGLDDIEGDLPPSRT